VRVGKECIILKTKGMNITEDSKALTLYLKEISKIPMLSPEEEIDLASKVRRGDKKSLDRLVEANLRFVVKIAKEYLGMGLPLPDLINEGNIGLMEAAKRFKPEKGFKFISYAVYWIRHFIRQALEKQARLIRLPANKERKLAKIEKALGELFKTLDRFPTADELAKHVDIPKSEIEEILKVSGEHMSLDAPIGNFDERPLSNLIPDQPYHDLEQEIRVIDLRESIERTLKTLSSQEEGVIRYRFGLGADDPLTLEEIGRRMGLTRERIRQIQEKAISQLRQPSRSEDLIWFVKSDVPLRRD
jgi:RNA polymerase primary sigma factor